MYNYNSLVPDIHPGDAILYMEFANEDTGGAYAFHALLGTLKIVSPPPMPNYFCISQHNEDLENDDFSTRLGRLINIENKLEYQDWIIVIHISNNT